MGPVNNAYDPLNSVIPVQIWLSMRWWVPCTVHGTHWQVCVHMLLNLKKKKEKDMKRKIHRHKVE